MISRVVKNKNYSAISNVALSDARLSLKAKGLYAYLMTKPDTWQISREGIRAQIKEGKAAIDAALGELEACGYLRRERTARDERGHFKPESVLYENPLPENQSPENPPEVITNKVSTDNTNDTNVSLEPAAQPNQDGQVTEYGDPAVNTVLAAWTESTGLPIRANRQKNRNAAKTLIRQHGSPELVGKLIRLAARAQEDRFAPRIPDLIALQSKQNDLIVWYKSITSNVNSKVGKL